MSINPTGMISTPVNFSAMKAETLQTKAATPQPAMPCDSAQINCNPQTKETSFAEQEKMYKIKSDDPDDYEAPDNYPSYGGKGDDIGISEKSSTFSAQTKPVFDEEPEQYYFSRSFVPTDKRGPDNYPSYGLS